MDQLALLQDLARSNGGVVRAASAREAGIPSWQLTRWARSGVIARIAKGVYVVGHAAPGPSPWAVTMTMNAALSFESSVAWWGVEAARAPDRTHATTPRNRGRRRDAVRGVRLHRATLGPDDVTTLRGVRVTTPLRTALDIARHSSLEDAVAIVDAFMRAGLLSAEEFSSAVARAAGPGRVRMLRVAMLVDAASGSILESLTRVLLWRNGMCPSASQWTVSHAATAWVGRLDFAWPELRVALECDGYEWHADRPQFQNDRRRWSTLTRMGWLTGVVTWFDVTGDPAYVVGLVADLLAAAHNRDA
jgi:predicted transcriptional regulator of viral defense system